MQRSALDEQAVLNMFSNIIDKSMKRRFRIKTAAILNGYLNEWQNSWRELTIKVGAFCSREQNPHYVPLGVLCPPLGTAASLAEGSAPLGT